jgi:multimeric flavodoxin WrbA
MNSDKAVLGIVGSPNRDGRTNKIVSAVLEGAARNGAPTDIVQLADNVVAACKDCLPWVCKENRKCTYDDEAFETLSEKILKCGALVLGTPVYFWDASGMVKYLILKMFRVFAPSEPLQGVTALGIAVAGETGNGLVSGLRPVYHFFQMMQMRAMEPLPVTRFNFDAAIERAQALGEEIVGRRSRMPFKNLEERLLWYDALPYFSLDRFGERRLLADLMVGALPPKADPSIARGLARADALAAAGKKLDSLVKIGRVYEAADKNFEIENSLAWGL